MSGVTMAKRETRDAVRAAWKEMHAMWKEGRGVNCGDSVGVGMDRDGWGLGGMAGWGWLDGWGWQVIWIRRW